MKLNLQIDVGLIEELYISDVSDKSFEILKAIASEYQSLNKKKGVQNVR